MNTTRLWASRGQGPYPSHLCSPWTPSLRGLIHAHGVNHLCAEDPLGLNCLLSASSRSPRSLPWRDALQGPAARSAQQQQACHLVLEAGPHSWACFPESKIQGTFLGRADGKRLCFKVKWKEERFTLYRHSELMFVKCGLKTWWRTTPKYRWLLVVVR